MKWIALGALPSIPAFWLLVAIVHGLPIKTQIGLVVLFVITAVVCVYGAMCAAGSSPKRHHDGGA